MRYFPAFLLVSVLSLAALQSCKVEYPDGGQWVESPGVTIILYHDTAVDGKRYVNVIYENFGEDTLKNIKYQLIGERGGTIDTVERIINLFTVMRPGKKHLVPRAIGEDTSHWDYVHPGKIWVQKLDSTDDRS